MTSHCANPECSVPLQFLREGRIFQFEVKPRFCSELTSFSQEESTAQRFSGRLYHFWLCGKCSSTLTLAFDATRGLILRPRPSI
jgi:hypothetical protein